MIIIPDIHGRTFWKEAVEKREPREKIVFLGDYMEPYGDEGITSDMSYDNLIEIIDFKKSHKKDVVLLLGNHDFAILDKEMITCRHDYKNAKRNTKLYKDNIELFDLAYSKKIGNINFLFTHAGVRSEWYENQVKTFDINKRGVVSKLNYLLHNRFDEFIGPLHIYSRYRGGWLAMYSYGSCVWSDVREWFSSKNSVKKPEIKSTYQIFGHTQLKNEPIIEEWFADLDTRCAYRLIEDENNELKPKDRIIKLFDYPQ